MTHTSSRRRAFMLCETGAIILVFLVLGAILLPLADHARRTAGLDGSLENLRYLGWASNLYSTDSEDRLPTFSWRTGDALSEFNDLNNAKTDNEAAANQAVDILRRRTAFTDLPPIASWTPHISYSPLVLIDYLNEELPARWFVSPGDQNRIEWSRSYRDDPTGDAFLNLTNRPPTPTQHPENVYRWMFSSSYMPTTSLFSPDMYTPETGVTVAIAPESHYTYTFSWSTPLGRRSVQEISFPARKILFFESHQRFFGRRHAYYAYPEARVPNLFTDGSARVLATSTVNRGFQPNNPASHSALPFRYDPDPNWEPPTLSGNVWDLVSAHQLHTRGGLRGVDVNACETSTGEDRSDPNAHPCPE